MSETVLHSTKFFDLNLLFSFYFEWSFLSQERAIADVLAHGSGHHIPLWF